MPSDPSDRNGNYFDFSLQIICRQTTISVINGVHTDIKYCYSLQ